MHKTMVTFLYNVDYFWSA